MKDLLVVIQNIIAGNEVDFKDKSLVTSLVVAETIASKLAIPTSPVENATQLFLTQHKVRVLELLGLANEHTVIDIDRVCDLVFQVWSIRYSLVHQMNSPDCGRLLSAIVAQNTAKLQPDYIRVANQYPKAYLGRFAIESTDIEG